MQHPDLSYCWCPACQCEVDFEWTEHEEEVCAECRTKIEWRNWLIDIRKLREENRQLRSIPITPTCEYCKEADEEIAQLESALEYEKNKEWQTEREYLLKEVRNLQQSCTQAANDLMATQKSREVQPMSRERLRQEIYLKLAKPMEHEINYHWTLREVDKLVDVFFGKGEADE